MEVCEWIDASYVIDEAGADGLMSWGQMLIMQINWWIFLLNFSGVSGVGRNWGNGMEFPASFSSMKLYSFMVSCLRILKGFDVRIDLF